MSASPYTLDSLPALTHAEKRFLSTRKILLDGPFKGDYSLAIVNRNLARALLRAGLNVVCHSREQDWQTDPMLLQTPDVYKVMLASYPQKGTIDIHLRNPWPPDTADMVGAFNAYVCFAWEETEIPVYMADRFSKDLDLIMVTANFVGDAIAGSGVGTPIEVVANGCDHIDDGAASTAVPVPRLRKSRILHVSSCFPRKGADLLVDAFVNGFSDRDDVELLIKTTPNPHNTIERYVAEQTAGKSGAPTITVINAHWTTPQINALYRASDMLVAPSRGEGFGLPFAEAMLNDLPVVATDFSGQTDFCTAQTSFPIAYRLTPSASHVSSGYSLWAEPDVTSIARNMRHVLGSPAEAKARTAVGKAFIRENLTWAKVAERICKALTRHAGDVPYAKAETAPTIDVVSTWQQKCGIATYSQHLYSVPMLERRVENVFSRIITEEDRLEAPRDGDGRAQVHRVWNYERSGIDALIAAIGKGSADILWFQHHPGHFSGPDMDAIGAALARSAYRVRVMTMHNVKELAQKNELDWTRHFDGIFVHSANDAALLSAHGYNKAVVIPHGFQKPGTMPPGEGQTFTVGSFGFLFPHKNVDMLTAAIGLIRDTVMPDIRLKLLNCVPPSMNALEAQARVLSVIRLCGLEEAVEADYSFLDEEEIVERLRECDLVAFPYAHSDETATGAARVALLANRPLLCSTSPVLKDLHPISHVIEDVTVERMAEAIAILAGNRRLLNMYEGETRRFLESYSYERMADRYAWHIARIKAGKDERIH